MKHATELTKSAYEGRYGSIMTVSDAMEVVLKSQHTITGTYGDGDPRAKVQQFLSDPNGADFDLYTYVGGIALSYFFASSSQAFNNVKNQLWTEIQNESGETDMPQPSNWDSNNTVMQIAVYVHAS